MYFLQRKKFKSGLSHKAINKLNSISKHYDFDGINVLYFKDLNKPEERLVVPELKKRTELINVAHLIGHFRQQATYERLKQKYYWPNMFKQVCEVISKCLPCIRNENVPEKHLPAQAIPIKNIFDIVSIDLVHGLPVTPRGNKSICVMVEHLTYVSPNINHIYFI